MPYENPYIFEYSGNHFILNRRDRGASRKLLGKVSVMNFCVDDIESSWDEASKKAYKEAVNEALLKLTEEAKRYGANLELYCAQGEMQVPFAITPPYVGQSIRKTVQQYSMKNVTEMQEYYENLYHMDEAPMVFALNKTNRSCASAMEGDVLVDEYCFIGKNRSGKFSWRTIAHEILHQFGAVDYYYPKSIKLAYDITGWDSLMDMGNHVDPLTAYLIGWIDRHSVESYIFLKSTEHITKEDVDRARDEEWKKWS